MNSKPNFTVALVFKSDVLEPDQPTSGDIVTICRANGPKIFTWGQYFSNIGQNYRGAPAHHKKLFSQKFICRHRGHRVTILKLCSPIALKLFEHQKIYLQNRLSDQKFWKFWKSFSTTETFQRNRIKTSIQFNELYIPVEWFEVWGLRCRATLGGLLVIHPSEN